MSILDQLTTIRSTGVISDTAWQFAKFVCRHAADGDNDRLFLAAILASQAVESSHVCVDLRQLHADCGGNYPQYDAERLEAADDAGMPLPTIELPEPEVWLDYLRNNAAASNVICTPRDYRSAPKPLVLDREGRLYLHRYYDFERELATQLEGIAEGEPVPAANADTTTVATALTMLFPAQAVPGWDVNWQKVAGFAALKNRLTIITGGPGTGKTTVVSGLLALLTRLCGQKLKVYLAAPTGKAAARLSQSLAEQQEPLAEKGFDIESLDITASTVHRMLGYKHHSIHFRHDATNKLDADLIVVDEASMVPLPMMKRIVDAVPYGARLILLGDRHQLASIETGYVLGDLCEAARPGEFSAAFRDAFAAVADEPGDTLPSVTTAPAALTDCSVQLMYSWRFPPGSAIDTFSLAVNTGGDLHAGACIEEWQTPGILEPLPGYTKDDLKDRAITAHWKHVPERLRGAQRIPDALFSQDGLLLRRYRTYLEAQEPVAALAAFEQFRILCATRHGPHGVYELNRLIEEVLSLDDCTDRPGERRRLAKLDLTHTLPAKRGAFYDHQPILITQNNYGLGLFNGDTGVILRQGGSDDPQSDLTAPRPLVAFFPPLPGEEVPRPFAPELLPAHETAWAMTIHKSQGSQFPDVLVVLPNRDNAVVGRELIYTAITRASARAELWLAPTLFAEAVRRNTVRQSGLAAMLSSPLEDKS